jgi:hypothetical protein
VTVPVGEVPPDNDAVSYAEPPAVIAPAESFVEIVGAEPAALTTVSAIPEPQVLVAALLLASDG